MGERGKQRKGKHLPISKLFYKTRLDPTLPSLNQGNGSFVQLNFERARY